MLKSRSGFSQTFAARLAFVDIASVLYFGLSYGLAIAYRKNVQLHARFMASTAILVLPPALARLLPMVFPAIHSFPVAFHLSYLLSQVTVVGLLLDDHRQGGLRMPYLLLLGVMLLQELGFIVIPQIPWWNELVTRLGT